jgi:hypothetical protein
MAKAEGETGNLTTIDKFVNKASPNTTSKAIKVTW